MPVALVQNLRIDGGFSAHQRSQTNPEPKVQDFHSSSIAPSTLGTTANPSLQAADCRLAKTGETGIAGEAPHPWMNVEPRSSWNRRQPLRQWKGLFGSRARGSRPSESRPDKTSPSALDRGVTTSTPAAQHHKVNISETSLYCELPGHTEGNRSFIR